MSTQSAIGIMSEGEIDWITCHNNGGESLANVLAENYGPEQAEQLIQLGDVSSVGSKGCQKPEGHSWATPVEGFTVAYNRDRGERLRRRHSNSVQQFLDATRDLYWVYVFDLDECRWLYARSGDFKLHPID